MSTPKIQLLGSPYQSKTDPNLATQSKEIVGAINEVNGKSGTAIIDVTELPTENIDEDSFYRLLTGSLIVNQLVQTMYNVYCVETLPETGKPATNIDQTEGNVYYNLADGNAYGYVDDMLSMGLGVPSGWYPLDILLGALGFGYSGVITDILDDPLDNTFRILLKYVTYSYQDGKWTSYEVIGWRGTGMSAEIFNHPSNEASGIASHAEGLGTIASGDYSHAEGCNTTASNSFSHAEGSDTKASGDSSHSEGSDTTSSGDSSHSEGSDTTSSGNGSHSEGVFTTASGDSSHAEGRSTTARGFTSHAEGYDTTASGDSSHAEGATTTASGSGSHSEGSHTIANGDNQHVQGTWNIEDTENKYAHIVGNGETSKRSNAHTLDWDGNAWFQGNVKIGGTGQDDKNAKTLATTEYVDFTILKSDIVGTWVFNNQITSLPMEEDDFPLKFTSGDGSFTRISFCEGGIGFGYYDDIDGRDYDDVYIEGVWALEILKTITITEAPTDTKYIPWLKANATKQADTSNLATVDKVKSIDTWYEGVSELDTSDGITWRDAFAFYDDTKLVGNEIAKGNIYHRVPIVAGNGIEFENDGQVCKINATGGGTPDNIILKYTIELQGSEKVTEIINQLLFYGYQLDTFAFVEFTGAISASYGLIIRHYGGNTYNIGGMDFGTFYTMANNVRDWSTVSLWNFSGYFQPPIPYCDESNEGQVLKVVNGVPTWTT